MKVKDGVLTNVRKIQFSDDENFISRYSVTLIPSFTFGSDERPNLWHRICWLLIFGIRWKKNKLATNGF